MTYDGGTGRWHYTYAIPPGATAVDFVFNSFGVWDNHGGADWHVSVTGGASNPHVVDGTLDAGMTPLAACTSQNLYADYDGRHLYVAAPGVSQTAGLDHFLFVARPGTAGTRSAPWAKAGTAPSWDVMLANEDGNGWNGWFDGSEQIVTAGLQKASNTVLEGIVDVAALGWSPAPESLYVWFGAFATSDGGALSAQVPCGDGDGLLEPGERAVVRVTTVAGVPERTPGPSLALLSSNPARGDVRARIDAGVAARVVVDLLDSSGRRVARLHDGPARGAFEVSSKSDFVPPGIYFLTVRAGSVTQSKRIALLE
jgi:hypothetical protein